MEKEFQKFLKNKKIELTNWQQMVVTFLFSAGRASGKSFLIKLLWEFDSIGKSVREKSEKK